MPALFFACVRVNNKVSTGQLEFMDDDRTHNSLRRRS